MFNQQHIVDDRNFFPSAWFPELPQVTLGIPNRSLYLKQMSAK